MDAFRLLDRAMAEQVVAVPKISCSSCPSQAVLRELQMVELLGKVPTILKEKQNVDIPVPRRGGAVGGTHGFLPGQGSSSSAEQIVHTPAHGRGVSGGLQGYPSGHGTLKRTAEQIADIPVPGGLRHDFLQLSLLISLESRIRFVFSHFSPIFFWKKNCDNCCSLNVAGARALELIHFPAS